MTIPVKSLNCGFSMPAFGMGTWQMGGRETRDPANDDASDIAALRAGLDAGMTHIDTAEMYAGGHSEELVGEAIAGRARERLFITSKVWKDHLSYDGVLRSAEGSLRRMGLDSIDLYLIHQVNEDVPLEETIRGLNRLQDEKLVRHIGVSNFAMPRLIRAQNASHTKIVANQVHYNLVYREPEQGLAEYCQSHDVMLVAWRPVQAGAMAQAQGDAMRRLCAKYGKTPAQIAINWLISQPNVATVAAMRSPRHLAENIAAAGFVMDAADVEWLRRDFPGQQAQSNSVPLK